MSKVFSKFKRTAITELVNSTDQRTITSVAIANGGTNYAVNDVLEIAGGTVLKVTTVNAGATNAILSINVVASGTYSDFTALSNVAVYNVSNSVANSVYGGQQTVSGANLRINVALDTNAVKTNRFYMLAAGTTEQESVPLEKETEYDSFLNIWEETVFGKSAGLIPVARRVNWEANTFYSAYDDRDELLSTKDFFVIDSGSKEIYKCIDNGATVSNTEPLSANNPGEYLSIISGTPFTLSDGYTWLYMGTVNTQIDEIYGTTSYFPVQEFANTKSAAINGGLFSIRVSSIGDNYVTTSGKTTVPAGSSTNRVRLSGAVTNPSYYSNSAIVVANTSGGVEVKRIDLINIVSVGVEVYSEVELAASENFTAGFLQNNQDYILAPYVEIESKTGSGAIAYPIVANDGSIERIEMVNYGSGYKDATAIVGTAPGIGSGAVLRPVISPGNGHGSHIFDELFVDSVCISSKFDATNFPVEPKYNTIALLKNPMYAKDISPLPEKTFNANTALIKDNTFNAQTGVNGGTNFITTTSAHGLVNRTKVKYLVSSGNTAIGGLDNDSSYFVIAANTTAFKLSVTPTGSAINLTPGGISEIGHTLRRVGQGYITIASNNLRTGDKVVYDVKTGNTAISPLVSGKTYYVASSNSTTISLSETSGGPAIALVPGTSESGHGLTRSATTEDSPFYGTSFVQTIEIPLQDNGVTGLTLGELIVGNNIDANTGRNPSGQVAFSNSTLLQVTGVDGMFVHSSSLTGQISGEIVYTANLSNWDTYFGTSNTGVGSEDYDVKLYSGDILYAKNVQEITRNDSSDEQIKIVIKL